jgi:hypothetical protein
MAQILERRKRSSGKDTRSLDASFRRGRRASRRIKENIEKLDDLSMAVFKCAERIHAATDKMMGNYQIRGNEAVLLESGNRPYRWRDAYLMLEIIDSSIPLLEKNFADFKKEYLGS